MKNDRQNDKLPEWVSEFFFLFLFRGSVYIIYVYIITNGYSVIWSKLRNKLVAEKA